jgi:DNA-binding transcriptional ArsR family regulator
MKYGPNISIVAGLMGDPARSNIVMALMSGLSLPATELAREAGVTPSTATTHLNKLEACRLLRSVKRGRNRYFSIADPDVAHAVEALVTVAARVGHFRTRPGPKDESMRLARSCYDHLAGRLAVGLFESWVARGILRWHSGAVSLTRKGRKFLLRRGVDVVTMECMKRPLCRTCIDWSERQHHLGGALGAAVLARAVEEGWAKREPRVRVVTFSAQGQKRFATWYS